MTHDRVMTETADGLLQFALHTGGRAYNDRAFQRLIRFSDCDETEQGRLFNELLVTAIGGLVLSFDDELFPGDVAPLLGKLRAAVRPRFKLVLEGMGIAPPLVKTWLKLYDLRIKEYREELEEFGPHVKRQLAEIAVDEPLRPKQVVTRMMVLATAALFHLRRQKPLPDDPLHGYLKRWLVPYLAQLSKLTKPFLEDPAD